MAEGKTGNLKTLIILILLITIAVSGYFTWQGFSEHRPIEIQLSPAPQFEGEIYIGGAVTNPGFYPFTASDQLSELLRAAGGVNDQAQSGQWQFLITEADIKEFPQRIDINRAEVWLLKTLPDIGDARAEAIVNYRTQNGRFHNINELTNVEGIGEATFERVKTLITVANG